MKKRGGPGEFSAIHFLADRRLLRRGGLDIFFDFFTACVAMERWSLPSRLLLFFRSGATTDPPNFGGVHYFLIRKNAAASLFLGGLGIFLDIFP